MVTNKHVDHAKPEYQRDGEEPSYMVKSTDTDGYSAREEKALSFIEPILSRSIPIHYGSRRSWDDLSKIFPF